MYARGVWTASVDKCAIPVQLRQTNTSRPHDYPVLFFFVQFSPISWRVCVIQRGAMPIDPPRRPLRLLLFFLCLWAHNCSWRSWIYPDALIFRPFTSVSFYIPKSLSPIGSSCIPVCFQIGGCWFVCTSYSVSSLITLIMSIIISSHYRNNLSWIILLSLWLIIIDAY